MVGSGLLFPCHTGTLNPSGPIQETPSEVLLRSHCVSHEVSGVSVDLDSGTLTCALPGVTHTSFYFVEELESLSDTIIRARTGPWSTPCLFSASD